MRLLIEASLLDCSESRRRGTGDGIFFVFYLADGQVWIAVAFAGVRQAGSLRWHPVFAFALASALCLRASCVAPVRLPLRWHSRIAFVLQASPLCGAMLST